MSNSPNMSYCMFQNTVDAIRQCVMSDVYNSLFPEEELSREEAVAFRQFVKLCQAVSRDQGE